VVELAAQAVWAANIAEAVLASGDRLVATARDPGRNAPSVTFIPRKECKIPHPGSFSAWFPLTEDD